MWRKDQGRRNLWVEQECKKYEGVYQKWSVVRDGKVVGGDDGCESNDK